MKVLLTGAGGQVGRALIGAAPASVDLVARTSGELDITDEAGVAREVEQAAPDLILNAAAYTAVDRAEEEEKRAFAVNDCGVRLLAQAAQSAGARLVHISTDFVFDGAASRPYAPDAATGPLSVYGRSKLAGEAHVGAHGLTVRTAWVYSANGANFLRTMLRLFGSRDEVRVVADQIGSPTSATSLARALWRLIEAGARGTLHYTDSGVASWYDFAVAIAEEASARGIIDRPVSIVPIATADYPTAAARPPFSVLDGSATAALLGGPADHWRAELRNVLEEVRSDG